MNIGDAIKSLRKKTGITQKQLASMTGLATITIQGYEAGKYKPKLEQMQKIAKALDVPIYALTDPDWAQHPVEAIAGDFAARKYENLIDCLYTLGYDIIEDHNDNRIWIKFPDVTLEITEDELKELEDNLFNYLQFKLEEFRIKKS